MSPVCPICGIYIVLEAPPRWSPDLDDLWRTLLVVRHVLAEHPDWLEVTR